VYEIYFDNASQTLFAGTYGRGAWKCAVPQQEPPVIQSLEDVQLAVEVMPNPVADYLQVSVTQFPGQLQLRLIDMNGNTSDCFASRKGRLFYRNILRDK
jgi:hypothetical protein